MKKRIIKWIAEKLGVKIEAVKFKVTDIQVLFTDEPAVNFLNPRYNDNMKIHVYIEMCKEAEQLGVLKYDKIIRKNGDVNIACKMSVAVPV